MPYGSWPAAATGEEHRPPTRKEQEAGRQRITSAVGRRHRPAVRLHVDGGLAGAASRGGVTTSDDSAALPGSPPPRAHRRHGRVEGGQEGQPRGRCCRNPRTAGIARRRPGGDLCFSAARARRRAVRTWHRRPRPQVSTGVRRRKEATRLAPSDVAAGSELIDDDRHTHTGAPREGKTRRAEKYCGSARN